MRVRRFLKLTIGAELRRQLVTSVKVRRGPRNDTIDFPPVVRKAHSVRPIGVGIGDKGYDSERNHVLLREELGAMSMIPPHVEGVPLWRTEGLYRKEMKRRFNERVYHQRAKDETIFSVVKRTMGDEMRSVRTKGLNNEIRVRMIAYNAMRVASSLLRGFLQSHEGLPNLPRGCHLKRCFLLDFGNPRNENGNPGGRGCQQNSQGCQILARGC